MRLLLTNDDGIDAPGLAALVAVAREFGEPVIVAPDVCHSAKSHAISMRGQIRVDERPAVAGARAFACSGTPADCVRLGLLKLGLGDFDAVFSGINPGGNAGVDVFYSGTVAAAREAAILGRIGVAISQLQRAGHTPPWEVSVVRAVAACQRVFAAQPPPPLVSINLPVAADGEHRGIRVCSLSTEPWPMEFAPQPPNEAGMFTEYRGAYASRRTAAGTDFHALIDGWTTITPLRLDHTDREALQRLTQP